MLRLKPISLRDANEYVRKHHRHHKPVAGHKFSIGCEADGELVGVIIAGRPVSRYLDDGFTLEVDVYKRQSLHQNGKSHTRKIHVWRSQMWIIHAGISPHK